MRKHIAIFGIALVSLVAVAICLGFGARPTPTVVLASSGGSFDPSVALEDNTSGSGGGMAQYAAAEQTSTSLADTQQAVANWNNYIGSRANWYFSSGDVTTIADADWNARQAGSPTITASQIASAASHVINNTLSTMSASQQQSMFDQYAYVTIAQGKFGTDWADPNVSATQNSNGTWSVSVSSSEFSSLKSFFQEYAPGMMSPGSNFYPGEAMIVVYAAASCDRGYGDSFVSNMATLYDDRRGLLPAATRSATAATFAGARCRTS